MNNIRRDLPVVTPVDHARGAAVAARIDDLTKPVGSLGKLEALAIRLAAMAPLPAHGYAERVVLIGVGDHGVATADVSAYPPEVTSAMVAAFTAGIAAVNAFARSAAARVVIADFGMRVPPPPNSQVLALSVGQATANFAVGPAMTTAQVHGSLRAGLRAVDDLCTTQEPDMVALGEMGIGNTTSAAALICALTGASVQRTVGRGTGIDDLRLDAKRTVISAALNRLDQTEATNELRIAAVGGFEIVALAGVIIGFAARKIPILLDGVSLGAAALIAREYAPAAIDYCIAAHRSVEPGHTIALTALGLEPLLELQLRLGEGTGAILGFGLCDAAARMVTEMRTFAEAGVATAVVEAPA
jgi:nicotinate-nucleotide--dimethylbenzimidazole phosphoribosyltransferase